MYRVKNMYSIREFRSNMSPDMPVPIRKSFGAAAPLRHRPVRTPYAWRGLRDPGTAITGFRG
jgi:hypothetical protein